MELPRGDSHSVNLGVLPDPGPSTARSSPYRLIFLVLAVFANRRRQTPGSASRSAAENVNQGLAIREQASSSDVTTGCPETGSMNPASRQAGSNVPESCKRAPDSPRDCGALGRASVNQTPRTNGARLNVVPFHPRKSNSLESTTHQKEAPNQTRRPGARSQLTAATAKKPTRSVESKAERVAAAKTPVKIDQPQVERVTKQERVLTLLKNQPQWDQHRRNDAGDDGPAAARRAGRYHSSLKRRTTRILRPGYFSADPCDCLAATCSIADAPRARCSPCRSEMTLDVESVVGGCVS